MARSAPELFPAGFDQGYCLHGFGRESLKLSGLKLRKIVLANGASVLAPPQLHLQLHDRNRRSVGVSLALGGA